MTSLDSDIYNFIYEETIKCTQCNLCILGCPMFMGERHDYYSPRALVILLRESAKNKQLTNHLIDLLFTCNLCGNCNVRCPAKINITKLVEFVRSKLLNT